MVPIRTDISLRYLEQKEPLDREKHGGNAIKYDASTSGDEGSSTTNEPLYNTPKTSLDDFELLKVIGKGSYGKVTLVRKKDHGRLFAMKSLNKSNVKRRNQVEHTRTERRVLGRAKHPFIGMCISLAWVRLLQRLTLGTLNCYAVHLHYAFQTSQKLYFVLDYCPGGELFFHLSRMEKFEEPMAKFYAAEITLALEHLHDLGVVYRCVSAAVVLPIIACVAHLKLTAPQRFEAGKHPLRLGRPRSAR